jgi:L-alanine-DL-glutamate epimerase-like enolase superfamily enzyme
VDRDRQRNPRRISSGEGLSDVPDSTDNPPTKITALRTAIIHIPFEPPIAMGAGLSLNRASCVLVFLESDRGVIGEGVIYTHNGDRVALIHDAVRSFEHLVVGLDPRDSGVFTARAWGSLRHFGAGILVLGLAAIESALFDLRAKLLDVNVAHMIGACRTAVDCYQSGALWGSLSIDQLQKAAAKEVAAGFRGLKMRLTGNRQNDVARVGAVREAIGPDIKLMVDANQRFSVSEAIRLGRELEAFSLAWFEEPVSAYDHRGEAEVAAALDTPVASGESIYTSREAVDMVMARACDVLTLDLPRVGGPTEFLKAAAFADAYHMPVSNHFYGEISLALVAAVPNGICFEQLPLLNRLYREPIELDAEGRALVPDRPGWGFAFDPDAVRRFSAG